MSAPPVNMLRCTICRRPFPAKLRDPEPLCYACESEDDAAASDVAARAQVEITGKRVAPIVEHHVPVEYARSDPRPFGLGLGELPASKLTQAIATRERADEDRERLGGARVAAFAVVGASCTLLGLIVLAVAYVR